MKIIKQAYDKWSYKFVCSDCDSELEADENDLLKIHYDGDFREPSYDAWSVNCPICGHSTSIKEDKIPKIVKVNHDKKKSYGGPFNR